jgi:hypothetical protein
MVDDKNPLNGPQTPVSTEALGAAQPSEEDSLPISNTAASDFKAGAATLKEGAKTLESGASGISGFLKSLPQLALDNPLITTGVLGATYGTAKIIDEKVDRGKYNPDKGSGQRIGEMLQGGFDGAEYLAKKGISYSDEIAAMQKQFAQSAQAGGKDISGLASNVYQSTSAAGRYMQETGQEFNDLATYIKEFGVSSRESILKYQEAMAKGGKPISDTTALIDGAKYAFAAGEMAAVSQAEALQFLQSTYTNLGTNALEGAAVLSTFGERVKGTSASTVQMAGGVKQLGEAFKYTTATPQQLSDQIEVSIRKYEDLRKQGIRTFNSVAQAQETLMRATQAAAEKAGDFGEALGVVAMSGGDIEDAFKFMFEAAPEEQMGMMLDAVKEQFGGELMTMEDAKKSGRTEDFMLQTMLLKDMYKVATPQQAAMLAPYLPEQAKASAALPGMRGADVNQAAIADTSAALGNMNQYLNTSRVELNNFSEALRRSTGQLLTVGKGLAREGVQEGQRIMTDFGKATTDKIMPFAEQYLGANKDEEREKAIKKIEEVSPSAASALKFVKDKLPKDQIMKELSGGYLSIPTTKSSTTPTQALGTTPTQAPSSTPIQVPSATPTQAPTQQIPSPPVSTLQAPSALPTPPIPSPTSSAAPTVSPQANTSTSMTKVTAMNTGIQTQKIGGTTLFTLGEVQQPKPQKGTQSSTNPFKSYGTDLVAKEQISFKDAQKLYETKASDATPKPSNVASNASSSPASSTADSQNTMTKDIQQLTAALKELKQPVKIETVLMLDSKVVASAVKTQTIALINSTGASQAQT